MSADFDQATPPASRTPEQEVRAAHLRALAPDALLERAIELDRQVEALTAQARAAGGEPATTGDAPHIRRFAPALPRVESGAIQFGTDWPGTFIRGDHSAQYASVLREVLKGSTAALHWTSFPVLKGLMATLESSRLHAPAAPAEPRSVPFTDRLACRAADLPEDLALAIENARMEEPASDTAPASPDTTVRSPERPSC